MYHISTVIRHFLFLFQNNPKNLDPIYKMDLDFLDKMEDFLDFLRMETPTDNRISGPGCSKLTTSLVNVSLNFQKLISQICQYFLSKKCE